MRTGPLAVVTLVAAGLGAAAALGVVKSTGWLDDEAPRTVVLPQTDPAPAPAARAIEPRVRPLLGDGFDPRGIYALRSPGVVTIYALFPGGRTSQGSGFVVSRDGYILTSSHVITSAGDDGPVAPARELYVEFGDHDRVAARVVGWDVFDDVGVVRVDPAAHRLAPLPLGDSSRVRVGEPVAAIGSPFGNENSLAVGVVSATHRSIDSLTSSYDLVDAIQVDAPINHGNSGGPLFDAHGRVIGINAQIRSDSGSAEGVGFAVPINSAKRSLAELVVTGEVRYAYVGITTETLTPSLARHLGLPVRAGALVASVLDGSPGARAGLRGGAGQDTFSGTTFTRGGDVIVAIDGIPVRSSEDVVRIVSGRLRPGQSATFSVLRGGKRLALPVILGERPLTSETRR